MQRTRTGRHIALSARDVEIFKLLSRYRYLRSSYLHAFIGGASETRFKERLGDLFHEGYLDRPAQQWEFADARCLPVVHELGAGAARVLRECGEHGVQICTFLSRAPHRQFRHTLMVCEVLASIELACGPEEGVRFIGWPEILARAPKATRDSAMPFRLPVPAGGYLVPDGVFGLEYGLGTTRTYRFFALEADRGTMPVSRSKLGQTSYVGKLIAYRDIIKRQIHKSHWGVPNLLVLTVTTSDARMAEMMKHLEGQSGAAFLFRTIHGGELSVPISRLLCEPWQRSSLPPLYIDR